MTAPASAPAAAPLLQKTTDFSLVLGGPLYQLWRGTRLAGDSAAIAAPPHHRAGAAGLGAAAAVVDGGRTRLGGQASGCRSSTTWTLHLRLLLALPLLIVAELVVHQRMRPVVGQFLERGLIPETGAGAVRRGDRLGAAPAQFDRGGGPPDCVRLRRRGGIHLADAVGARRGELVRRIGRMGNGGRRWPGGGWAP